MDVDMNALSMDLLARIVCLIMLVASVKGTETEKTLILKYEQVQRSFTILCTAEGKPAPQLAMVLPSILHNYTVTLNETTPPTDGHVAFTSKLKYMYPCVTLASSVTFKCCIIRTRKCTNDTVLICKDPMDSFSTHGIHVDDVSSDYIHYTTNSETIFRTTKNTTTANTTTTYEVVHSNNTYRRETREWLLPIIIGGGVVAVIVAVIITVVVWLSKGSMQQGPLVNGGLQWGNHAEQVERFEMNTNREDGPHDTAVYANVPAEVIIAPNTQGPHTSSLALGPDTDCKAVGPDDTGIYSKARSVDWEEETTVLGEKKELTYVELNFSENHQTPGPSNRWYQPVEYVMVDFTQTKIMKSE